MLVKAYCSASENSVAGANQKKTTFWDDVHKKWMQLYAEEECVVMNPRPWTSLDNRWRKHIQQDGQIYNKYWTQLKSQNPSGWTPEMFYDEASKLFQQYEGKPFRFLDCIKVIHASNIKIDPLKIDNEDPEPLHPDVAHLAADATATGETNKRSYNAINSVMGADKPRPQGTKAAKLAKKAATAAASLSATASITTSRHRCSQGDPWSRCG